MFSEICITAYTQSMMADVNFIFFTALLDVFPYDQFFPNEVG